MSPFFTYLIQINIALALFYLLYAIVLKKDTFLWLRRLFFLSSIVFSLLYPFWTIPLQGDLWSFFFILPGSDLHIFVEEPEMTVLAEEGDNIVFMIPWIKIIFFVYCIVTALFLLRFVVQLLSIFRIKMRSQRSTIAGVSVYTLKNDITPFSFFKWIFIHSENHSDPELSQILLHEQTHMRQWHSIDIMLIEQLFLFSWWNPFIWLMKREITMNLEYLADNGVLREGVDSREYQYNLLRLTYHETAVQIVNNFNVSQLKQRIMMMNKAKSPALKVAKYLLILPLALLLIFANSCINQERKSDKGVETGSVEPSPADTSQIIVLGEIEGVGGQDSDIFEVVEDQASFPGGMDALRTFLVNNLHYSIEAQEKGIQGKVILNFVVEKDGSLSDIRVLRGIDPLLDEEAVRVVKRMPRWIPGKNKGEIVRARFTLPVAFQLKQNDGKKTSASTNEVASDTPFEIVQQSPEFPGGIDGLNKWLRENLIYPVVAQENGIQGKVIMRFVIEKDGSVTNAQVLRSVDASLDKEAMRVVGLMPKWKPGIQKGKAVRVYYTMPVAFQLKN